MEEEEKDPEVSSSPAVESKMSGPSMPAKMGKKNSSLLRSV